MESIFPLFLGTAALISLFVHNSNHKHTIKNPYFDESIHSYSPIGFSGKNKYTLSSKKNIPTTSAPCSSLLI